ncbi:SapC family protein [Neptuniibacter sp.]|uniref:SapC family protein n=1 Tax=Neptuniibacter sp. TaxID=1962643 RepID=UPI00261BAD23|nr:SapC family protein [Neptuniibacter sp.]MCP4598622.1 SapC family protein [Neptuniibacter sp.]
MAENQKHIIQPATDSKAGFAKNPSLKFSEKIAAVPVTVHELVQASGALPLAIAKLSDTRYQLVALLGLEPQQNLVLQENGNWRAFYVPTELRLYPFGFAAVESSNDDQQRYAVCFEKGSDLYRDTPNEAAGESLFFDDQGKPTTQFAKVIELLKQHNQALNITGQAVTAIASEGLLTPFQLPDDGDGIKGIYRINEKALNALDKEALERLHKTNALPVVYAQLFSMHNLRLLTRLKEMHAAATPDESLLEELFGDGGDSLSFE